MLTTIMASFRERPRLKVNHPRQLANRIAMEELLGIHLVDAVGHGEDNEAIKTFFFLNDDGRKDF